MIARFVRPRDAARYLGVSKSFLDNARLASEGPRFSRLGRSIVYALADLDKWVNDRAVSPRSEMDALKTGSIQATPVPTKTVHHAEKLSETLSCKVNGK